MDANQITELTLAAWDDVQQKAEVEQTEPQETEEVSADESDAEAEAEEQAADDATVETEDEQVEEEAEEEGEQAETDAEELEEEEEQVSAYATENPRVQAFLEKYGGDPEKALAAAAHLEQVLGRQGLQMGEQAQRIEELQSELGQLRTFGPGGNVLTPEQREWAAQAIESEQPVAYVQEAMRAGEFGLARAICDGWSEQAPYEAARLAQQVDLVEQQAHLYQQQALAAEQQVPFDTGVLMEVLVENYPDMAQYEQQMVASLSTLGEHHPLVQDARSQDPETAAKGIIGLYEIARAQSATVKTTRTKLKRDGRQAADEARTAAVVSSAQASPKPTETPRERELMPGLTMSQLDEAWGSR